MRTFQNMPRIRLPISWSSRPPLSSCLLDVKAIPGRWWCKQRSSWPFTGPRRFRQLKVACSREQCDSLQNKRGSLHWVQNNMVSSAVDSTIKAPWSYALGPLGQTIISCKTSTCEGKSDCCCSHCFTLPSHAREHACGFTWTHSPNGPRSSQNIGWRTWHERFWWRHNVTV